MNETKDRMIAAAVTQFARAGFHGVTTKEIALVAKTSEGNIFRYFPSKRDLFIAAIDCELEKLNVRAQVLDRIEKVANSKAALRTLFELITDTIVNHTDLVRLLQFSALEFGADMEPVYRKHLDSIVNTAAANFQKWSRDYGFRDLSAHATVLSFVATVIMLNNYSEFTGAALPFTSVESAAAAYAELWFRVLTDGGAPNFPNSATTVAGVSGD
jgi:AcrR family transcriptional regulator